MPSWRLPGYTVVGLPDAAGRESRERVRAALLSSGLEYPQQRVTVNLAPASVRKTGHLVICDEARIYGDGTMSAKIASICA